MNNRILFCIFRPSITENLKEDASLEEKEKKIVYFFSEYLENKNKLTLIDSLQGMVEFCKIMKDELSLVRLDNSTYCIKEVEEGLFFVLGIQHTLEENNEQQVLNVSTSSSSSSSLNVTSRIINGGYSLLTYPFSTLANTFTSEKQSSNVTITTAVDNETFTFSLKQEIEYLYDLLRFCIEGFHSGEEKKIAEMFHFYILTKNHPKSFFYLNCVRGLSYFTLDRHSFLIIQTTMNALLVNSVFLKINRNIGAILIYNQSLIWTSVNDYKTILYTMEYAKLVDFKNDEKKFFYVNNQSIQISFLTVQDKTNRLCFKQFG